MRGGLYEYAIIFQNCYNYREQNYFPFDFLFEFRKVTNYTTKAIVYIIGNINMHNPF